METLNKVWGYCIQKLILKSNNEQIKPSSDNIQNGQFNSSIDQALGISTSIFQINLPQLFTISSSSIPIVKNVIYISEIINHLGKKIDNLIVDRMQTPRMTPYLDEDKQKFNQMNIDNVYQCKRENIYFIKDFPMAKLHTEHTDTIFCSNNTCMLASFHENQNRVDQGIYKKGQASKWYIQCQEYQPKKQVQFSEAQVLIDEFKKEEYNIFNNNCHHSSNKIIEKLDLKFINIINLENL